MAPRAVKSSTPMCDVSIDYNDYLLPLSKAQQVVTLLQQAKKCEFSYNSFGQDKQVLTETQPVRLGLEVVTILQIKPKPLDEEGDQ